MAKSSAHLGLPGSGSSDSKASVLLVDDNPANILSLRAILDDPDYKLVEARSGEEALQRVQSDEFAVILLDVLMPGIGGFETARRLRDDQRPGHTPIIFLTASDIDRKQMEEAYALGAVDFLGKPLLPLALKAKVRGLVDLYHDKQAARHEADQFRLLVQGTSDYAIFMLDPQGRVLTWNAGAERFKGYKANEIIGQHFSKFYPQDAIDRGWPDHELRVATAEGRFEDEGWRLRKDGSRFWANVVITALRDEKGELRGFSKVTRDLSERKHAEETLRRSEERFRLLIESVQDYAIFLLDPHGNVATWNAGAERFKGYKADEIIGQHFSKFYPQEAIDRGWPAHELKVATAEGRFEDEGWRVRKDGSQFWANVVITALKDNRGRLLGFSKITRDLTARKQAEESARRLAEETAARQAAHKERERLKVTLASIGDAVISTDAEGRVEFLNSVAEELVGWKSDDAAGRTLEDVFRIVNENTRQSVENPALRALRDGRIVGLANHTVLISQDGTERPIDDSAAPIRNEQGEIFGSVLIFRDVAEQRQAERERNTRMAVTHALGEAATVDATAESVLRAVCENMRWDVGFLWRVNEDGTALGCAKGWHTPGADVTDFEQASFSRSFAQGEGLPGFTWAAGQPQWILDVTEDGRFPRAAAAAKYGLHSAVACPVAVEDRVLGVIEFFTRSIRQPDADLLEMMGTVAGGVGQFIERKAAENEIRESERELADFFENATVGLHWVGADGTILRANRAELELLGYSREEYVGRPIADFHADENVICDILKRLQAGEKLVEYPARLRCKDGSIKNVLIDSSVRFKDGEFVHTRCFTRDVTERLRAEATLRQSQEQLAAELEATTRLHALSTRLLTAVDLHEALNDVLQEAILICRAKFGNVQLYNSQSHALEIIAQRGFREDFLKYFRTVRIDEGSACAQALESGERIIIEDVELDPPSEPHRSIAATTGYRAVQSTPLKNRKGNVIGMLSTHFSQPHRPSERDLRLLDLYARHAADLIERHAFEEALRRSESQFRQLADVMPQIVWTARPDGNIDYMNRRWSEFTGLPESVGNEGWAKILHPDEVQPASERWAASVRSGAPFEMEIRLLERRRLVYRWHLIRTVAIHDDAGNVIRWFGTSTDIHEQKRAEESSRFLAAASAALASVVDHESTLQKVASLAVPHFADWSAVDMVNGDGSLRRLAVAHQDADKIALVHQLMQEYPLDPASPSGAFAVLRSGEPYIMGEIPDEMLAQVAKDERHLALIRSLGLKSYMCVPLVASGKPLGVLTFATAESGRRYTEVDLTLAMDLASRAAVAIENTQLYQALRETDRRKDEFLATLAHELRNPLAPIRNALQILKMPRIDPAMVGRSRDIMERQVEHLVRLVDDLLDVSRVMRGKIELRKQRVELAAVVARAVEMVQPLVDAQGHQLSVRLTADSLPVDADPVRLAQVVGNLLTNAAKYMEPHGRIWLTAEREGGTAVLQVRDTGIGIVSHMLPRIFELFVQADHATTKAQGGLGIGLTLVKNLVEMHNGTVAARSRGLGEGSEFVVRLPLSAQLVDPDQGGDPGEQADQPLAPSGYRLLVVDDNQDAADSLAMLLKLQGHEVRVAFSGMAALEMTKTYTPDVVFLDIGMPGIDGYEVARRLRQQPGLAKTVLAALTGWGQQEDRRRTAEAGFDHHLVKPPNPKALEGVLAGLERLGNPQAEG